MLETLSHWTSWTALYLTFEWGVRLVMLCWVPTRRSPEAAKGWLLLLFFQPVIGLALYGLIGRPNMPAWRRERLRKWFDLMRPIRAQIESHIAPFVPQLDGRARHAATLAHNLGRLPPLAGNSVEFIGEYQSAIDRLARDIDTAEHHVHLLYYIFADDEATRPVIDAMARAVRRGVKCRVLVDALGSRKQLPKLRPTLEAAGVQLVEILKSGPLKKFGARADLRNHRKIAVIDGRTAFTGSQNLISSNFKPGITYEEAVVRVTGPAVVELQSVFVGDWYLETEEVLDTPDMVPAPQATGDVAVQVLPSGPTFAPLGNQRTVVSLLYAAERRIVMTTPYFIPDAALQNALQTAAIRGVEVHLIVSEIEDQFLVGQAQKSYYEELLETGVRIHLFQEEFLHAKHLTIDDDVAMIGSSNMDLRSFTLNAEISLLLYDRNVTMRLHQEQRRYFDRSKPLTLDEWRLRPFKARFSQNICRLMSPLL